MSARELFQIGDRVQTAQWWLTKFPHNERRYGVVCGFGHDKDCVRVRWGDVKTPDTTHIQFVEHQPSTPEVTRWSARREGLVPMK